MARREYIDYEETYGKAGSDEEIFIDAFMRGIKLERGSRLKKRSREKKR